MNVRIASIGAIALALAAWTSSSARAQDYAPANLTAAQVLERSAAARGRLEPGSYVLVRHTEGGGEVTESTLHVDGNNVLTIDQTGPFTTQSGTYDGQHWRQDSNGTVFLESNFRGREDPNTLAWEHPSDPSSNVTIVGMTTIAPQAYVLEAKPMGGSDQLRYYDARTMLLTREVTYAKDRHQHVVTYDDYRTVFGTTRAFHTHASDGRAENETDTTTVSFAADASPPPMQVPASKPLFDLVGNAPLVIPTRFTRAGIVVRVTIAGRGLDFLLDSGSSTLTIDPGVARQLGLTLYGRHNSTIGGDVDISRTKISEMDVGPLVMHDVTVSVVPLSQRSPGSLVVGLLGSDFLASAVIGIDFPAEKVTLYPRDTFAPSLVGATSVGEIEVDDGVPRIDAKCEGVLGHFMIDTGGFSSLFYRDFAGKLPDATPSQTQMAAVSAIGGSVPTKVIDVHDFVFGSVNFGQLPAIVPQTSTFDALDYDGIVGRNILAYFATYLDYAGRRAYFRASATPWRPRE